MTRKEHRFQETVNGRISLLFIYLLLFGGLLWLLRTARYRYDLIFRKMLPWLMPILFIVATGAFLLLLIRWIKGGKKDTARLFSPSFTLLLPIPLMAAFLFPWLTHFTVGFQFFRLATELIFYGAVGAYAGYIGYYKADHSAPLLAGATTLNCLALFYFYDRFLSPASFILNTEEFGYLHDTTVAGILAGMVAAVHLVLWIYCSKKVPALKPGVFLPAAVFTLLLLPVTAFVPMKIFLVRWLIFGGMGLMSLWYMVWCVLKHKKIL